MSHSPHMDAHPSPDQRPLLLIDIDGVLNREVSNSVGKKLGYRRARISDPISGWRYTMHLNPSDGAALLAMRDVFELAWCTTWRHAANGYIRTILRLPEPLPVVDVNYERDDMSKVPAILRFAGDRPFVWLDDDVWDRDHDLLAAPDVPEHLVIRTHPVDGMTAEHLEQARAWAASR